MINPLTPTQALRANLSRLSPKDQDFAKSLCDKAARAEMGGYQLSDKQLYWIGELARRAQGPQQAAQPMGGLEAVHALLHRAGAKLKHPKVVIEAAGKTLRLSIAGPASSQPGSINVTSAEGGFDSREWYGRIGADGVYTASRKFDQTAVLAALRAIAADPAQAAKLYGQRTGRCCFCGIELTDPASFTVGYGPICAEHWGLPHGDRHGEVGGYRQQPMPEAPITPTRGVQRAPTPPQAERGDDDELNDDIPF